MTIQNTTIRKAGPSQGNGVNVSFPFTFKVFASADVLVTYLDAIGTESSLVLSTDYTVALNADQNIAPGGAVTLLWTPATGTYITLTSQVSNTQNLALTNAGGFYPTSINDALDRIVIQVQQLAELISRSAKAPLSGIGSLTASSLVFGVDSSGIPVLSQLASISSTAVSTFMNTLLGLTSASAVKTALSVQSDLQTQANTQVLTTGTSTAYIAVPSPIIATPTANTRLRAKFHLASGVTPTLTVGSVTAALQQYDSAGALVAATMGLNQLTDVEYNGTVYVVLNPLLQTAGDVRYAKLAGLNTQVFSVANGVAGNDAVNFGQVGLGKGVCKAWVNFDGTLTGTITPRGSFNVSSITKNGIGDYTINFTTALTDANYAVAGTTNQALAANRSSGWDIYNTGTTSMLTTSCRINAGSVSSGAANDVTVNTFMVFGN